MASLFTYTFIPDYTNAQELIKVIIIGIVEGISEWLPIMTFML